MQHLLEIKNISKSFGATMALNDVSLTLTAGETLALVGENGAGKSTLMKILSGVVKKDTGKIYINSNLLEIAGPKEALRHGISTVYQELSLCPNLSVAENIFVNREPCKIGIINRKKLHAMADKFLGELDIDIKPNNLIKDLSLAQRQMVEILKAVSINAKILILDEPTSALEITEVKKLFELIKKLKDQNTGIVFISHKLDEVFDISDNIAILRDGCLVTTLKTSDTNQGDVVKLMVGRSINQLYPEKCSKKGKELLRLENFGYKEKFNNINLSINEGEILGLAGLSGAGRTEVMHSLFGYEPKDSGDIFINGKKSGILNPKDALSKGIAYSPEDRKDQGLFLNHSIELNISAANLKNCSNNYLMQKDKEEKLSNEYVQKLAIKTESAKNAVNSLSGGNQQKVLLAKYLATSPRVFIVDEPTRGIDIGSKVEIHRLLRDFAQSNGGVIVISSDLMEVVGLCDRVIVFHEGRIKGELSENITEHNIMKIIFNN